MANEMNLWKRLKGETPKFFKRVIKIAASLFAVGLGIIGIPAALTAAGSTATVPAWLTNLGNNFMLIGLVAGVVSGLTVTGNSPDIKPSAPNDKELNP